MDYQSHFRKRYADGTEESSADYHARLNEMAANDTDYQAYLVACRRAKS